MSAKHVATSKLTSCILARCLKYHKAKNSSVDLRLTWKKNNQLNLQERKKTGENQEGVCKQICRFHINELNHCLKN